MTDAKHIGETPICDADFPDHARSRRSRAITAIFLNPVAQDADHVVGGDHATQAAFLIDDG